VDLARGSCADWGGGVRGMPLPKLTAACGGGCNLFDEEYIAALTIQTGDSRLILGQPCCNAVKCRSSCP